MKNKKSKGAKLSKKMNDTQNPKMTNLEKTAKDLNKIITHTDVFLIKKTTNGYILRIKSQHWRISKTKYTKLDDKLNLTSDVFFGDLKWFYRRFVSLSFVAEDNSGKIWTKEEYAILGDMIDDDFIIGDIASELKRDLNSIVIKGAAYSNVSPSRILSKEREYIFNFRFSESDF